LDAPDDTRSARRGRVLVQHDENLAARVKREVRNKLETGLKKPPVRI
jgi:predicted ABC-type transport system involved in lysophospholipase L1 biosynthesis ATPase subunit